jgi:chromosome segregation and condensation protein ScpB
MPSKLDDLVFQVEAVLFASGKPLAVKEIADALGLDDYRPVQRAVRTLEQTYGNRQSALEVRRVGDRYALQLQEKYVPTVHSVTPVEMTARTLRALTLIAYHQPILQSHLVRMIGDVAYEEVQRLRFVFVKQHDVAGLENLSAAWGDQCQLSLHDDADFGLGVGVHWGNLSWRKRQEPDLN